MLSDYLKKFRSDKYCTFLELFSKYTFEIFFWTNETWILLATNSTVSLPYLENYILFWWHECCILLPDSSPNSQVIYTHFASINVWTYLPVLVKIALFQFVHSIYAMIFQCWFYRRKIWHNTNRCNLLQLSNKHYVVSRISKALEILLWCLWYLRNIACNGIIQYFRLIPQLCIFAFGSIYVHFICTWRINPTFSVNIIN